jgi:hypothetical protein
LSDKGKPVERRGRKAIGSTIPPHAPEKASGTGGIRIARLPNANEIRHFSLSAFIEAEKTMTLNAYPHRTTLHAILLLAILSCLFFNPAPALSLGNGEAALPDFAEFTKTVQNSEATVLRGVYVPEVLALPVSQQPAGNAGYVSNQVGEVTQFGMAAQFGNVGLLAHNHLAGSSFSQLAVGQEVRLVYGNGTVEYFVITQILQFQALEPTSQYSSFRDLTNHEILTAEQLFNMVYRGKRHVTFQTCIAGTESLSWGRLFVIAIPKTQIGSMNRFDPKLNP